MNYKLLTFCEDWADEHNVPALACMTEEEYNTWLQTASGELNPNFDEELKEWYEENKKRYVSQYSLPKRVTSNLNAWLGNSGDCFEEQYEHLYLMKEFVEAGIVKVFDVSEEFYNMFHKAQLSGLSMCNVFCIEDY